MSLAYDVALALGKGKKPQRNQDGWQCFCPCHNDKETPSLSVKDTADNDIAVHCFAGCHWKDVKDELRRRSILPEWKSSHSDEDNPGSGKKVKDTHFFPWEKADATEEAKKKIQSYLATRSIRVDLEPDTDKPNRLPFPPALRYGSYYSKKHGETFYNIVAAATTLDDRTVRAVQRIFIDPESAEKIEAKMLSDQEDDKKFVGRGVWFYRQRPKKELLVGEGIETTLSVMQTTGKNGVATLSVSGMRNIEIPAETETAFILADSDLPPEGDAKVGYAGQRAAIALAGLLEEEGKTVYLVSPDHTCFTDNPAKLDFNDLLQDDPTGQTIRDRIEAAQQLQEIEWRPPEPGDESSTSSISILTLSEISEENHLEKPIIDGLLDEKESLLFCGQSGIGKSLLSIVIASALGDPPSKGLWGKFSIPHFIKTLIIQSENSRKATSKRLKAMLANNPELISGLDHVFIPSLRDDVRFIGEFQDRAFQDAVAEMVEVTGAGVIVWDPLISYHGQDENDNSAMRRSLDALTEIMDRTGTASILFHHVAKSQASRENGIFSGRGAAAVGDWAANILSLSLEKAEGPEAVIKCAHEKARNFELQKDFYLRRTRDLQFHLIDKPGDEKELSEVAAVIDALKDMPGYQAESQAQLRDCIVEATDWSERKVRRAINKAVEMGKVLKTSNPAKKQGYFFTVAD